MNKGRRKEIEEIEARLSALKQTALDIKENIESIHGDEEDAKDNLPDSLRDGEKGEAMDTNIQNLESATEELDDIESSVDQALEYLQAAREGE